MKEKKLKIFYAAGPGDIVGTYEHWKAGRDDPSQVAMTYSGQFFELCRQIGADGYAISYCPRPAKVNEGNLKVLHRAIPFMKGPGPLYHLGQVWSALRMTASAVRFGADIAVVSDGAHWFALRGMKLFGIRVVPTLHCVLWRKHQPVTGLPKLIRKLNARFFAKHVFAVMSLSSDITEQVKELTDPEAPPIEPFVPSYRPASFEGLAEPPGNRPFRVFFAGRIERNKGVFDLLHLAEGFAKQSRTDIEFDLCGSGSALEELRGQVQSAGLADRFRLHGHSTKPVMRRMFEQSHVVIAPTTTDFIEGFNKTVAEGVLAGRPVITSSVCPALSYVQSAVVEVPPDDREAYGRAILQLADDQALYERKRAGAMEAQGQFYDPKKSWAAALTRVIRRFDSEPS